MAFRAFYALPVDSFTTSTGQPTNAVHGFVSMFLSLIEQEEPTHVAVAFDLPGGTFRTQEYPGALRRTGRAHRRSAEGDERPRLDGFGL